MGIANASELHSDTSLLFATYDPLQKSRCICLLIGQASGSRPISARTLRALFQNVYNLQTAEWIATFAPPLLLHWNPREHFRVFSESSESKTRIDRRTIGLRSALRISSCVAQA